MYQTPLKSILQFFYGTRTQTQFFLIYQFLPKRVFLAYVNRVLNKVCLIKVRLIQAFFITFSKKVGSIRKWPFPQIVLESENFACFCGVRFPLPKVVMERKKCGRPF